ncbi:hypothetical protein B9G54_07515 [Alloscardovia macacae]|uniref:Fluoride-specific ion channel FluC n=1 Tax=Alloscardovia macacae TaxID=1160091 RepID=A0A1Y2SSD0_9BIFI|nr:CrcB family protein [Alloscardovia macacae]OTA25530.1 hypothetical protein B9G54_07515 [Alloscardovia macacae]OTA28098.1 hypothetical protein B9T39_07535 [Alloscardovia macacae]
MARHGAQRGRGRREPARSPLTDLAIYAVVFAGGVVGTAARYGLGTAFAGAPQPWDIHWGTFAANALACFLYAFITASVVNLRSARTRELLSRGLGMGMCGGLSTMSTLALEITANGLGWAYALVSICAGVLCAILGAWAGGRIGRRQKKIRENTRAHRARTHRRH